MHNATLIIVLIVVISVVSLVAGFFLGSVVERNKRKTKDPSGQPLSVKSAIEGRTTKIMPEAMVSKGKETINSLFSTLITLKGKDANEVFSILANFVPNNTGADCAALLMKEKDAYVIKGAAGLSSQTVEKLHFPENDGIIKWLKDKGLPIQLSDKRLDAQMRIFKQYKEGFTEAHLYPLGATQDLLGVLIALGKKKGNELSESDTQFLSVLSGIFSFFLHNMLLDTELEQTNVNTLIAIAIFLEKRDMYTQGHSERVRELSEKLAKRMRFERKFIATMCRAAALHDIGKIGIRDEILNKPGKLTEDEFAVIKEHPEIAARMLKPLNFLKDSLPGILYHHERFDGTGYPQGLKGDQIPEEAQIITIADVYDALTTDRPYRKAFSHEESVSMMMEMNRKNFNPEILKEFLAMLSAEKSTRSHPEVPK